MIKREFGKPDKHLFPELKKDSAKVKTKSRKTESLGRNKWKSNSIFYVIPSEGNLGSPVGVIQGHNVIGHGWTMTKALELATEGLRFPVTPSSPSLRVAVIYKTFTRSAGMTYIFVNFGYFFTFFCPGALLHKTVIFSGIGAISLIN